MDIRKLKIKAGEYCLVIYQDASYAYQLPKIKNTFLYPKLSKSVGRVRLLHRDYLDLGTVWVCETDMFKNGLIIPMSAIRSIKRLSLYGKK
ncbi:hypothetical protein IPJ70_03585 [Candidatus Campbellbacteria bacterium]|nr:MAG: hypothetical protein IPJ70_03585 [Candidatus Campbellbacteria bacterium]